MLAEKGKKMMYWFLLVYAVFGIMLVYLFLFVPGLEITEQFNEEEGTKEVYVQNATERIINNVSVKYRLNEDDAEAKPLDLFTALNPGEKRKINLDGITSAQIIMIAESPYHATVEKTIVLRNAGDTEIKLNFPSEIVFGKTFGFSIEICNRAKKQEEFKITESHDMGVFSEPGKTDVTIVTQGECSKIPYTLTPLVSGETTIYFNVKSSNTNEEFEQKIMVD